MARARKKFESQRVTVQDVDPHSRCWVAPSKGMLWKDILTGRTRGVSEVSEWRVCRNAPLEHGERPNQGALWSLLFVDSFNNSSSPPNLLNTYFS